MKTKFFLILFCCMCLFSSCLKSGLDEIENSNLCAISSVALEHRWLAQNANGYDVLCRQQLTLSNNAPDENKQITFVVTVPSASNSDTYSAFNESIRNSVSLERLYLTAIISSAATITPLNDAPQMGTPASFEIGKEYQYEVTAANGEKAVYTIVIQDFEK